MHSITKLALAFLIFPALFLSCADGQKQDQPVISIDSAAVVKNTAVLGRPQAATEINTKNTTPGELIKFAKTLIGVPYNYTGTDPSVGFDCSGFITYVFDHFNIKVPRSSVDFTHVGKEVSLADARQGDLVLFTGTDSTVRIVGHMGIVTENNDSLKFIHATSGKIFGVTVTPLNRYYKGRFMKVTRIFNSL